MLLKFGGVPIGAMNATRIAPKRTLLTNAAGIGYAFHYVFTANFSFTVTGQDDCKTKMDAIEAALQKEAQDLRFENDDGSLSTNSQTTAGTIGGVRCIDLSWDPQPGGQFTSWRSGEATFTWTVKLTTGSPSGYTAPLLKEFSETVVINNPPGKGFVVHEAINDVDPQAFDTVQRRKSTGSQRGFAVGISAYPTAATPLFNTVPPLKNAPITRATPERIGSNYWMYRIDWNYEYDSPTALIAVPTLWSGT